MQRYIGVVVVLFLLLVLVVQGAEAQTPAAPAEAKPAEAKPAEAPGGVSADDVTAANNPLQPTPGINFQDYYAPSNGPGPYTNSYLLRAIMPIKPGPLPPQIIRATLPINTFPRLSDSCDEDAGHVTGLGDLNVFDIFLLKGGKTQFGIGPLLTAPTATDDALGTGKWQAGLTTLYVNLHTRGLLMGGLVQWQESFAGQDDRPNTNSMLIQPFFIGQLGQGWYWRSSGIATWNIKNSDWYWPVGLGFGKAFKVEKKLCNAFVEPQFTVAHSGDVWPQFQVFAGFNIQFLQ
jgi:hypothetical protein